MQLENIVYVYNKNMQQIARFEGDTSGLSEEAMQNLMVSPIVHIEQNGASTLSFQMLANCQKWQDIKDPENIYVLNGRHYTALNENSYEYISEGNIRIVNVTLVETWYKLANQYHQAYNCSLYCYAPATSVGYVTDGLEIKVNKNTCYNAGKTISNALAYEQVKTWGQEDEVQYSVTEHTDEWTDCPSLVTLKYKYEVGDYLYFDMSTPFRTTITETFTLDDKKPSPMSGAWGMFQLKKRPIPKADYIQKVVVNSTVVAEENGIKKYTTSNKDATFYYEGTNLSQIHIYYTAVANETINYITITYSYCNLGTFNAGKSELTLGYGAEVVDEHTFVILPKSNTKYKLTIDGVAYSDSEVVDSRGVIMERGSAGYAMWAALKNTGWKLGICDNTLKGFDTTQDYGCYNVESDMQDTLTNVRSIQELYGGILVWDSANKTLHYRAESKEDYRTYDADGFNDWTGYEFRLGKNMADYPAITYDNNIVNKAYILGYNNLNIKEVNNGKSYVEDYSYTNDIYEGYLEQPLIYDTGDDSGKKQLLEWGKSEVAKMCKPRMSVAINCFDIRTVDGYEHETFDLNDIVKVYYKEKNTDEESVIEKRIISWEYNAFANYDCNVEVGDKKRNSVQIFKLIYKKSESSPETNGSGNLSASSIQVDSNGTTLAETLEQLVKSISENSTAISGLKMYTDNQSATNELFTTYQSTIDGLTNSTYAGLKTYTDKETARVELSATKMVNGVETSLANFKLEVSTNYATIESVATTETELSEATTKLRQEVYGNPETGDLGSIATLNNSIQTVDGTVKAQGSLLIKVTGSEDEDKWQSLTELTSSVGKNTSKITTYADNFDAFIHLDVFTGDAKSYIHVNKNNIELLTQDHYGSKITMQNDGNVLVYGDTSVTLQAVGAAGPKIYISGTGVEISGVGSGSAKGFYVGSGGSAGYDTYLINGACQIGGGSGLVMTGSNITLGSSASSISIGGSSGVNITSGKIDLGGGTLTIGSTAGTSYFTSSQIRLGGSSGVNITNSQINIGSNSYFTNSSINLGGKMSISSSGISFGGLTISNTSIDSTSNIVVGNSSSGYWAFMNTTYFTTINVGSHTCNYQAVTISGKTYYLLGYSSDVDT